MFWGLFKHWKFIFWGSTQFEFVNFFSEKMKNFLKFSALRKSLKLIKNDLIKYEIAEVWLKKIRI
jgi:hypothetical protein